MNQFDIKNFEPEYNMYIEASAGTGKTYTIQQIVGELLKRKPKLSLEQFLIVTYTEKAAGELRDRIRAKLQQVVESSEYKVGDAYLSEEEQKENFQKQLDMVDNAPIFTIHSFCQKMLDEFAFTAKKPASLGMIDESAVIAFLDKWIRDVLPLTEDFEIFKKAYIMTDGAIVRRMKDKLFTAMKNYYLDFSGQEIPEIVGLDEPEKIKGILEFEDEELRRLAHSSTIDELDFLLNFYDKIHKKRKFAFEPRTENEVAVFFEKLEQIDRIDEECKSKVSEKLVKFKNDILKNLANGNIIKYRGNYDTNWAFKQSDGEEIFSIYEYFSELKKKTAEVFDWLPENSGLNEYLYHAYTKQVYMAWQQEKSGNKLQSFDDMLRNMREAICEKDSALKKNLQKKFRYAIIDEFQDTNQKQWDIFSRIFMEDDGHSIFVVGDPKQSIYSFQGADVNVYRTATEIAISSGNGGKVKEGKCFSLGTNWRSTTPIINACNAIFRKTDSSDFFDGSVEFFESDHPKGKAEKPCAEFYDEASDDWKKTEPLWIPYSIDDDGEKKLLGLSDFSKYAVSQIAECCKIVPGTDKTKLRVYKKDCTDSSGNLVLQNVNFGDFAILAKAKSEMENVKRELALAGIPYSHYKEANLFSGRECMHWISVFNAINAPDFMGVNRSFLNEVLFSQFFNVPVSEVQNAEYDRLENPERSMLLSWQLLAQKRKWAELLEKIFDDTEIEGRLSQMDKLPSLSKYRQIGDYAVNYLYKNNCSLDDLVKHLSRLSNENDDTEGENGNLVAKGSDFNTVQIMTCHASKGLEFPVVIALCGLKGKKNNTSGVYFYHDEKSRPHLSYTKGTDNSSLSKETEEKNLEWSRIFYVAYTRATSLMLMPWRVNGFAHINAAFENFPQEESALLNQMEFKPVYYDSIEISNEVSKILSYSIEQKMNISETDDADEDVQQAIVSDLNSKLSEKLISKHDYTNLTHGTPENEKTTDNSFGRSDEKEGPETEEAENTINIADLDDSGVAIKLDYCPESLTEIIENYPKGSFLGEAVHEVFEEADFEAVGKLSKEEALADKKLCRLINSKFWMQGLKIDEKDSKKWRRQTAEIIWNTLNASFPEIIGSMETGKFFCLKELDAASRLPEIEFNMNPEIEQNKESFRDFFKGFIDLLFVREIGGKKIYSILDWKSDKLGGPEDFADSVVIKQNVDQKYSIQRVLYSYCLIKWLMQFYPQKTEQEIFDEFFGGIYYVFVRGCNAGFSNGIYAHTWKSWSDLENSFNRIVEQRISRRGQA